MTKGSWQGLDSATITIVILPQTTRE